MRWEITGIAEKRLRESTLLQVVPKDKARLPSSACLSQSFSYHADLLDDDGDGLRTPPGARGGRRSVNLTYTVHIDASSSSAAHAAADATAPAPARTGNVT